MGQRYLAFFDDLEEEIKSKWNNLSCKVIHDLYFDFWEVLKRRTGSASGFTGLSEVIVFLVLKTLIEEKYKEQLKYEPYSEDTYFLYNSKFAIGRNLRITIESSGKTIEPDIALWRLNSKDPKKIVKEQLPDGAIEVKIYASTPDTITNAINNLKTLKRSPTFKGFVILYKRPPERDIKMLEEEKTTGNWFDYLILEDDCSNFVEILSKHFEL